MVFLTELENQCTIDIKSNMASNLFEIANNGSLEFSNRTDL